MANLHAHFLHDPAAYARAESVWRDLWKMSDQIQRLQHGWQTDWIVTTYADGTPMHDGNPIFSAYSPRELRGIRIIQHEPTGEAMEFEFWLGMSGGDITDPNAVVELVISCALSDQSLVLASLLIDAWIQGSIEYEQKDGIRCITSAGTGQLRLAQPAA